MSPPPLRRRTSNVDGTAPIVNADAVATSVDSPDATALGGGSLLVYMDRTGKIETLTRDEYDVLVDDTSMKGTYYLVGHTGQPAKAAEAIFDTHLKLVADSVGADGNGIKLVVTIGASGTATLPIMMLLRKPSPSPWMMMAILTPILWVLLMGLPAQKMSLRRVLSAVRVQLTCWTRQLTPITTCRVVLMPPRLIWSAMPAGTSDGTKVQLPKLLPAEVLKLLEDQKDSYKLNLKNTDDEDPVFGAPTVPTGDDLPASQGDKAILVEDTSNLSTEVSTGAGDLRKVLSGVSGVHTVSFVADSNLAAGEVSFDYDSAAKAWIISFGSGADIDDFYDVWDNADLMGADSVFGLRGGNDGSVLLIESTGRIANPGAITIRDINENIAAGQTIFNVNASDPDNIDTGNGLTYELVGTAMTIIASKSMPMAMCPSAIISTRMATIPLILQRAPILRPPPMASSPFGCA